MYVNVLRSLRVVIKVIIIHFNLPVTDLSACTNFHKNVILLKF